MSTNVPNWAAPCAATKWPENVDRIFLDSVDSTMAEAARLARELSGSTWILAHEQTAARGRRGRAWVNPVGNFSATLLMRPDATPAGAALRSFVTALAVRDTLATCIDPERLTLKWPNDVLLDGGKVAGILLESSGGADKVNWLSIGIGVNLVDAPPAAHVETGAVPPVSISGQGGSPHTIGDMLWYLADNFAKTEHSMQTFGFEPVRQRWLAHAARLGETIRARTGKEEHFGTFRTVDETGNLVLDTANGTLHIAAAEVFF